MAENDRNIKTCLLTTSLKLFGEDVSNWSFRDFTFPVFSGRKCEQNMIIGNVVGEERESRAGSEYLVLMINNSNVLYLKTYIPITFLHFLLSNYFCNP